MKNKKGFTLIELLAVIVILAIIALIAVPTIMNILNKSNESAFKDTAHGIISAGELYYAEQELNGESEDKIFNLPADVNTEDGLQLKGQVPTGIVKVTAEGKVAIAIQNGRYCVTKGLDDAEVTASENIERCYLPYTLAEFKDTAYGIVSAGELYYAEQELNSENEDKIFNLPADVNTEDGLKLKGQVPTGIVKVTAEGKVAIAIQNGRYCVTKGLDDAEVTASENIERCYLPYTLAALSVEKVACATDMTEDSCFGTVFTINVNDNEPKNFYVIKDEGNKVTLIMTENLGDKVEWVSKIDYTTAGGSATTYGSYGNNNLGPITAINYLDGLTDEEWSNIPKKDYTYSGLDNNGDRKYEDITRTMRARMITDNEVKEVREKNKGKTPDSMKGVGAKYWTSTPASSSASRALFVDLNGELYSEAVYNQSRCWVRPVIELSK